MSRFPTPPYLVGAPQLPDDLALAAARGRPTRLERERIRRRLVTLKKEIRRRREEWEAVHGPWNAWTGKQHDNPEESR